MPRGDNNRRLSPEQVAEVVRTYTTQEPDGTWVGVTTIAKRFGVAHSCVQYHLRRAGVQMRTAKAAHSGGKRCKPIRNLPAGEAPRCACNCGMPVPWSRAKNRWLRYAPGHYTQRRDQSHAWLGGITNEPYSFDWPEVSRRIRKRDAYTCQDCGAVFPKRSGALHVHHIDCDKQNNADENLVSLCRTCHGLRHAALMKPRRLPAAGDRGGPSSARAA